jgi:linoleoyl-CoA desaturase
MTVNEQSSSFYKDLRKTIFFDMEQLSLNSKGQTHKAIPRCLFLFVAWALFYAAYLAWGDSGVWANLILSIPWALTMSAIQMSVMHDASHGSLSENPRINQFFLQSINFLGGSARLWVSQHCHAHHSFTNVENKDHDINTGGILRLNHFQDYKSHHRYQHVYAWLLYPLFVLSWIWWGDTRDLIHNTYSLSKKQWQQALVEVVLIKIWHVAVFIALPLYFFSNPWFFLIGYLVSFGLIGFIMVVIFQLAHVSNQQVFTNQQNKLDNDWAVHQLRTTVNFATSNRLLTWFTGGLNYQIEHHIFPQIYHGNYRHIHLKLKEYCEQRGLPYYSYPTLWSAVKGHQDHLRKFSYAKGNEISPHASAPLSSH